MQMEKAVIKMVEAARQKDVAPERLARLFKLTLEKVAGTNPVGEQALKIVQTDLLKNLLKDELKVAVRLAKGPRKPRGSGTKSVIASALGITPDQNVKKRRGRPPKVKSLEVA